MRYFISPFLVCMLLVFSCASDRALSLEDYSPRLQQIIKDNTGIVRGIDFTMNDTQIREKETASFVKEESDGLLFDLDLNETEFVDISYAFGADKVLSKIEMNAYLKDVNTATSLHEELKSFFNKSYQKQEKSWTGKQQGISYKVSTQLLENPKDPGVVVSWTKE